MDWSIPNTLYPSTLPQPLMWVLFTAAIVCTFGVIWRIVKRRGLGIGFLLLVPTAAVIIAASMILSMVVAFFVHDL